ncbi:MAG: hypothetical protein QM597_10290, partial [Aeromicrobium sp.]|uniref:Ig-like domain-containing protein n=1 Tax=Aeromicrobium sp. TaxID=1871063 RepID=UPI0039E51D7A
MSPVSRSFRRCALGLSAVLAAGTMAVLGTAAPATAAADPDHVWLSDIALSSTSNDDDQVVTLTFPSGVTGTMTTTSHTGTCYVVRQASGVNLYTQANAAVTYTPTPVSETNHIPGFECYDDGTDGSRAFDVALSKPVQGLIFHVLNQDGSQFVFGGGAQITQLSGNSVMTSDSTTTNLNPVGPNKAGCTSSTGSNGNGRCGSFLVSPTDADQTGVQNFTLTEQISNATRDGLYATFSYPGAELTKVFSSSRVIPGQAVDLTFTVANPSGSGRVDLVGMDFTDALQSGLVAASDEVTFTDCGDNASSNVTVGAGTLTFQNLDVDLGTNCVVTVSVVAQAAGTYANTNDNLSSTVANIVPSVPTGTQLSVVDPVAVVDDSATLQPGEASVAVDVLANDASGLPSGVTLDATSVKLVDPADGQPKSSVTTDEGTWTVDATTGVVTFTPVEGFTGETTPLAYVVTGSDGLFYSADVVVDVVGSVTPDSVTLTPDESSVTFHPGDNDSVDGVTLDPTSVRLVDPDTGDLVDELVVDGVGTWTVDTDTGEVTFTPEDGFVGETPSVSYVIESEDGTESYTSTMTVDVWGEVTDDSAVLEPDSDSVTVDVLANDTGTGTTLDATTVGLIDPADGTAKQSVTTDEGTWTVDATTGEVTFTPAEGFVGETTPLAYVVTDTDGATYTADIVVDVWGAATADEALLFPDETDVTVDVLANDNFGGRTADPTSVLLVDPDTGDLVTEVVISGVGTWTVDTTTGEVTFTRETGYTGTPPAVSYVVEASDGTDTATYTAEVTVKALGEATDDTATLEPGSDSVTVDVLANDTGTGTTLDATTVELVDPADGTAKQSVTTDEGTWTVDATTGEVTFTPADGFVGETTPLSYLVTGADGTTYTADIVVEVVGSVTPDSVTLTPDESSVTFHPGDNDSVDGVTLDPTSVRLVDPDTGELVDELVVDGVGTWTVDTDTGEVTFTPEDGFVGETPSVSYVIENEDGTESYTSTMTVDVWGEVTDDTATVDPGSDSVAVDVLANDSVDGVVLDPSSVRLVDPDTGGLVDEVLVDGVGTWSVDTSTGVVTFTPVAGYVGEVPAISYVVDGDDGVTYTAEVSVEVIGAVTDDVVYTVPGG